MNLIQWLKRWWLPLVESNPYYQHGGTPDTYVNVMELYNERYTRT